MRQPDSRRTIGPMSVHCRKSVGRGGRTLSAGIDRTGHIFEALHRGRFEQYFVTEPRRHCYVHCDPEIFEALQHRQASMPEV